MLKCHIRRGNRGNQWLKTAGTAEDLMVEVSTLISLIYQGINRKNPEAATGFKNSLIGVLLDPNSPVWKESDHEDKKEKE